MGETPGGKTASELRGKTLQVYLHLLKLGGGSVSVRELQGALNFSSPSVAHYHLQKLVELGLVEEQREEYRLVEGAAVRVLRHFIVVRGFLIPRHLFYAAFFTTMTVLYILLYPQRFSIDNIVALLFGVMATIILWIECVRSWKERPF